MKRDKTAILAAILCTMTVFAPVSADSGCISQAVIKTACAQNYARSRDISKADITLSDTSFSYTGSEIKPSVTVILNYEELVEGKDYRLIYSDNTEQGTASVTIRGKARYRGIATVTFEITPAAPDDIEHLKATGMTSSGYTLRWSKTENAASYNVYRMNSKGQWKLYRRTDKTSLEISGEKPGKKAMFRVCPVSASGEKGKSITGRFSTKPDMVKALTVSSDNIKNELYFSWAKVSDADNYQIFWSDKQNGSYRLFREVSGKDTSVSVSRSLLPKSEKIWFSVRAVNNVTGGSVKGVLCSPKTPVTNGIKQINDVLSGYKNSKSLTVLNGQGFSLTPDQSSRLMYQLTYLGGDTGYLLYDIDSGRAVAYNADTYFNTASTVKLPYTFYSFRQMDKSDTITPDTYITLYAEDKHGGSGVLQYRQTGTQYTIRNVIEHIGKYSDNTGYYMMQHTFGFDGYRSYIASLGATPNVTPTRRWGVVSACDSARELVDMWDYLNNGKYRDLAKQVFSTTCAADFRAVLGKKYTVYEKSGWTNVMYNETALVEAEHPYIIICHSNRRSAARMNNVALISEEIHNAMYQ